MSDRRTREEGAASTRRSRALDLKPMRRAVQLAFFVLWVALFVGTRWDPTAVLPPDLFLFTDPLVAVVVAGASRMVVAAMAFALVLVLVTVVLGRVFCGWVCPLGTLLDLAAKVFRPPPMRWSAKTHRAMQRWKYYLLVAMVASTLLSVQWGYLLDPLVLLFRGVTAGVYPVVLSLLPRHAVPTPLALSQLTVAFVPVLLLLVVIGLTAITPRFYCRYLCPLGAFYGLLARWSVLRRRVDGCNACRDQAELQCVSGCRMGALGTRHPTRAQNHECIRCFSDPLSCRAEAVGFAWAGPRLGRQDRPLDLSRRSFLVSGALGAGLAPTVGLSAFQGTDPNHLIRPPRVLDETTFVQQCVRCLMCVQTCPSQTLQPTHLEGGLAGLWSPAVTPRVGGCVADCNACAEVCPTGAIPHFGPALTDKWAVKMGTAVLETGRCIVYGDGSACDKCAQICPTQAIIFQERPAGRPRPTGLIYSKCVGCGLCEQACRRIVFGEPAWRVFAHGRGEPTVL